MPLPARLHSVFQELNPEQRKAVEHVNGPLLILAGAGSGKTRALTNRIANLMRKGVKPWQILAVTFTNKAANEMKDRIVNLLHLSATQAGKRGRPHVGMLGPGTSEQNTSHLTYEVWHANFQRGTTPLSCDLPVMGTFHSVCARILRRDIDKIGRDRNFVIYDADDQEKLMKQALKEMKIEESKLKARAALVHIGRFKCEAIGPKQAQQQATTERMHRVVQAFTIYQKKLREASALDFDDLILETVRLFHECPDVLQRYQRTWQYLNVDEYQDTNHTQYLFISLLARRHRNLCVIGDPDQSIYAFRGADVRNILEFKKEYPDAKEIKLEQNYRSTQPILTAADTVIAANPNRPQKKMWTDRNEGPKITIHELEDEQKEAYEAVQSIKTLRASGIPLREQVILYRTNAQSRLFEESCMQEGIPYRIVGGLKFYARREVKDILAYLHVILNPLDTVSLLRIINIPPRKIGQTTLLALQNFGAKHFYSLWDTLCDVEHVDDLNTTVKGRINLFVNLIEKFREHATKAPVSTLTRELMDNIRLEQWLQDGTDEGETRWQNVMELFSVMQKYENLDPIVSLTSFLEEVSLVSEVDRMDTASRDALTLMTLHLVKGLEFEHVIIAGCEEGIFPHSLSMFDHEQIEEERRLMYVGMTRAKTHLRILCAKNRLLWGQNQSNIPSRFLDGLPEEIIERRSDNIMSSFVWNVGNTENCKPTHQSSARCGAPLKTENSNIDIEFNQDLVFED